MAAYPWGAQSPAKRVATVERQIASNEKKKAAAVEAHNAKIAGFDEVDKGLKADLRQAQNILDREERDQIKANASKSLDKVLDKLISDGVDLGAVIESGEFAKAIEGMAKASGPEAATKPSAKSKKADAKSDGAGTSGDS